MLAPFLVVIETVSYLIRAISLGVRLAANISAGHLLFAILSGFAFNMLSSGMIILSFLPMLIMIFIGVHAPCPSCGQQETGKHYWNNGSSNSGLRVLLINHYLFGGHYSITLSGEIPVAQLGGAFTF